MAMSRVLGPTGSSSAASVSASAGTGAGATEALAAQAANPAARLQEEERAAAETEKETWPWRGGGEECSGWRSGGWHAGSEGRRRRTRGRAIVARQRGRRKQDSVVLLSAVTGSQRE